MFSPLVEKALRVTLAAHAGQYRKGAEQVDYATHPAHIAIMLAGWGFEEHVICAGLLHDVVEDCEEWTLELLEQQFGVHVTSIVSQLTEDKSLSWNERKRWAVEHVPHMSPEAASVKAVDKIHNLRCLLGELQEIEDTESVWARFHGGRERTLAMDEQLVAVLTKRIEPRLGRVLRETYEAVLEQDGKTRSLAAGS